MVAEQWHAIQQGIDPAATKAAAVVAVIDEKAEAESNKVKTVVATYLLRHVAASNLRSVGQIERMLARKIVYIYKTQRLRSR